MSTTLNGSVSSRSAFQYQSIQAGVTYQGNPLNDYERQFSSSDVTKVFFNQYSIGTGGTTIDVTNLTDSFGNALSFGTVKHLSIINLDQSNNLTINASGSNLLVGALPALVGQSGTSQNGSCIQLTTNITTSGSVKNLVLASSAGTITVTLLIAGT